MLEERLSGGGLLSWRWFSIWWIDETRDRRARAGTVQADALRLRRREGLLVRSGIVVAQRQVLSHRVIIRSNRVVILSTRSRLRRWLMRLLREWMPIRKEASWGVAVQARLVTSILGRSRDGRRLHIAHLLLLRQRSSNGLDPVEKCLWCWVLRYHFRNLLLLLCWSSLGSWDRSAILVFNCDLALALNGWSIGILWLAWCARLLYGHGGIGCGCGVWLHFWLATGPLFFFHWWCWRSCYQTLLV